MPEDLFQKTFDNKSVFDVINTLLDKPNVSSFILLSIIGKNKHKKLQKKSLLHPALPPEVLSQLLDKCIETDNITKIDKFILNSNFPKESLDKLIEFVQIKKFLGKNTLKTICLKAYSSQHFEFLSKIFINNFTDYYQYVVSNQNMPYSIIKVIIKNNPYICYTNINFYLNQNIPSNEKEIGLTYLKNNLLELYKTVIQEIK